MISRRELLGRSCALPLLALQLKSGLAEDNAGQPIMASQTSLPDKARTSFDGVYRDAAFTHSISAAGRRSYDDYLRHRVGNDVRIGPRMNPRDAAVGQFAKLIGANPSDIAVIPSTMEGENLIAASLGLGRDAGVVTDAIHYDASLV